MMAHISVLLHCGTFYYSSQTHDVYSVRLKNARQTKLLIDCLKGRMLCIKLVYVYKRILFIS